MERLEENYQDRDMIRCDDGNKVYLIPRRTFARMVLEVNVPGNKFVRYKTGADMYDMSERQFKEIAKQAGAVYKLNLYGASRCEETRMNIWNVFCM